MSSLFSPERRARLAQLAALLLLMVGVGYLFSPAGLAGKNARLARELEHAQQSQAGLLRQVALLQQQRAADTADLGPRHLATMQTQLQALAKQLVYNQPTCHIPPGPSPDEAAHHRTVALLRDQLNFANADCLRQLGQAQKPHSAERKRLLQEARSAFIRILYTSDNEDLKQAVNKVIEPINVELGHPMGFYEPVPQ